MKKLIAVILIAAAVVTVSVINFSNVETNKAHACYYPGDC